MTFSAHRRRGRAFALVLALSTLAACGDCAAPPDDLERCMEPEVPAGRSGLTWHQHIGPLLEARCVRCHHETGLAPFPLDTYEDAADMREAVRAAVVSREMPPWMPATCCQSFEHSTALTDEQIADIAAWVDDGAPEGDPSAPREPVSSLETTLPRVDLTLQMPEPYTPAPADGAIDDYRCFLVDWPRDEDAFVTGFAVHPSNEAVLHHSLMLILSPEQVDDYRAIDDADERPGWSCPGGGILGLYGYIGAWSPGWDAVRAPEGKGHHVPPGGGIVFSMHYSMPADASGLGPDQTTLELMVESDVEATLKSIPLMDATWPLGNMPIPADDDDVRHAAEVDAVAAYSGGEPMELFSVNLHMHERGKSGLVGITRADGSRECLLQIDDYRHEWQGDYTFVEPPLLQPGDKLFVECRWDNTAARQRVLNGEREEPRDLNWGDDQEMCVAYVTTAVPR